MARAEAAAGGPGLTLEPRGYVLGQLTRKPDGRTFILHLLNYDHQVPAENVKVRLDLSGLVQDLSRWEVKVVSPDAAQPRVRWSLSARERLRVHPAPDRALYRGGSLAQAGAIVLSNRRQNDLACLPASYESGAVPHSSIRGM